MKRLLCMALALGLMGVGLGCSQIEDLFKEKKEPPLTPQQKVRLGLGGNTGGTDEPGAVQSLRTIVAAQANYLATNPDKGFACNLDALGAANLVDAGLVSGSKGGYRFHLSCEGGSPATRYRASAVPELMGSNTFCVDESGVIKSALGPAERCFSGNNVVQ